MYLNDYRMRGWTLPSFGYNTALHHNSKLTVVVLFTLATYVGITQRHDKVKIVKAHFASYAMIFFISCF
jgi:hypothetical protein